MSNANVRPSSAWLRLPRFTRFSDTLRRARACCDANVTAVVCIEVKALANCSSSSPDSSTIGSMVGTGSSAPTTCRADTTSGSVSLLARLAAAVSCAMGRRTLRRMAAPTRATATMDSAAKDSINKPLRDTTSEVLLSSRVCLARASVTV